MNYTLKIDHELKIIRYTHTGNLNSDDMGEVWQKLLKMREFTKLKYNLFSDYRKANFNVPVSFIPKLVEFMNSIKHVVNRKKQSIIIHDPYSVAITMLYEDEVYKKVGFKVMVFSTEESAMKWICT